MTRALAERSSEPIDEAPLPRRPRRRRLTGPTAAVLAAVTCAAGFYAGVRVEKGQVTTSGTPRGVAAAAAFGRGATAGRGARATSAGGRSSFSGSPRVGGAGGATPAFGTVASVDGKTLVLTESSGNTVKVRITSATTIDKTKSTGRGAIHPGDTITVSGTTAKSGTVSAATVTDGGASGSGSGSGSATGSGTSSATGSGGSARAAIGSLFSGGG
jgi:Domain of unknown function (DUF5666)